MKFKKEKNDVMYARRTVGERIVFIIIFVWFGLYALSMIGALLWALLSSFKNSREFFSNPVGLPEKLLWENYADAVKVLKYKEVGFVGMIWNSIWLTIGSTLIATFTQAACGYVFARFNFPLKKFFIGFNIFVITIPLVGAGAAGYKLIYDLNLDNSPLYLITSVSGCFGTGLIIWEGAFRGQSGSYVEAAYIDGAGNWTIFLKIVLPLVVPVFLALSITSFISGWNDYMTSLMYMDNYPTLAAGLYFYREELKYASNEPLYFAGAIISIIPPVAIFAFMQTSMFDKISMGGGLKG